MAYIKKTYVLRNTIEIEKVDSWRYGKKTKHSPKTKPTEEAVKKVNERNSEKKLRRLINLNFEPGDYHVVLTYKKDLRPDKKEAKSILKVFIRKLRKELKKHGIELKYIHVTEYKNTIHHHIIVNNGGASVNVARIIADLWQCGRPKFTILDDSGDYAALAHYLIKETGKTFREKDTPNRLRYTPSRNLKQPKPDIEIIKANKWNKEPKAITGYYIVKDSIYSGENEITGIRYQYYTMCKKGNACGDYSYSGSD